MAASDIFTFESEQFLVLVDYYSKYIEVTKLKELTSQETIQALEEHFGRHEIPARNQTPWTLIQHHSPLLGKC